MDSSSSSKRVTRSQTLSVLGKRPARSLSRSSSITSLKNSNGLLTPDQSPDFKKSRTSSSTLEVDGSANKENIPPLRDLVVVEIPRTSRMVRRASTSSDISMASTRSRTTPRRHVSQVVIPQTPTSSFSGLSLSTPPPTPTFVLPLHMRIRGLLRATSNAGQGMSMDGREAEQAIIKSFLQSFDDDDYAGESLLYVSGSPGTGKTALVNAVIASTQVNNNVKIIFLNCMTMSSADALWEKLEEELLGVSKGKAGKRSPGKKNGRDFVTTIFDKHPELRCILILDELDSLSGSSSGALQPLFNLAVSHASSLRIIGIANTHTLTSSSILARDGTEAHVSSTPSKSKTKTPVSIKTIHFAPYTASQLLAILKKRFENLPQNEVNKLLSAPALMLLSKKVSALTGDVRVLFEVLRGAIDLAVPASNDSSTFSLSDSMPAVAVTPSHILSAMKSYAPSTSGPKISTSTASPIAPGITACNSEIATIVRNLHLQARLVLVSLICVCKRASAALTLTGTVPSPSKQPVSPTKRSPMKRSSSSSSVVFASGPIDSLSAGIDSAQLHAYYSSLLTANNTFTPVSRTEFADILGVLETTGLVSLSKASSSTRVFKRSASFGGKTKASSAGMGMAQSYVTLRGDVREAEVARGLGIDAGARSVGEKKDVLEDEVRSLWIREMGRIRREVKANDERAQMEGIDTFEDAIAL